MPKGMGKECEVKLIFTPNRMGQKKKITREKDRQQVTGRQGEKGCVKGTP